VRSAQHRKISDFVAGAGTLIAEFCDIQSGRDDSRAELQRAIQLAKRENAKIVIARLDRFSRRVSFVANILEQGIGWSVPRCPTRQIFSCISSQPSPRKNGG
jgi:DNA invertase Pin-like site-specific DNA recombinase